MTINWYPGHMHKAQKEIRQALPDIDLIIEVLDARIPYSSSNPLIAELIESNRTVTPVIKLLNKSDLADPVLTQRWCDDFESHNQVKALPVVAQQPEQLRKLIALCHKLGAARLEKQAPIRAMIMGIPNVGKSTVINGLAGRKIAKVGNEPAVTKRQQRIDLEQGIVLFDTPGILWPKIENGHSGYRLGISGAIKDTAIDYDDIAFYAVDYWQQQYPGLLQSKFDLAEMPEDALAILLAIGRKRGCLKSGGRVQLDQVCKIVIAEFRNGGLGQLSLETPEMIKKELIEVAEQQKLKAEKKAARKNQYKKR